MNRLIGLATPKDKLWYWLVIVGLLLVSCFLSVELASSPKASHEIRVQEGLYLPFENGFSEKVSLFIGNERRYNMRYQEVVRWMARILYTESNRVKEQYYIAWVVRNRYQKEYRGAKTYRGIALAPFEFSGFNNRSTRNRLSKAGTEIIPRDTSRWRMSLRVARRVLGAPEYVRPIPKDATHFYAPIGMPCKPEIAWTKWGCRPNWARGKKREDIPVPFHRLRVYSGVS